MSKNLTGKCALVTGGSRGIGAAIVKRLSQEGAQVSLTYVNKPDRANEVVQAKQALGVKALVLIGLYFWAVLAGMIIFWKVMEIKDTPSLPK